jgi:hypothetical protein
MYAVQALKPRSTRGLADPDTPTAAASRGWKMMLLCKRHAHRVRLCVSDPSIQIFAKPKSA